MLRFSPLLVCGLLLALTLYFAFDYPWLILLVLPLAYGCIIGLYDVFQTRHTLRRNFPLLARIRWVAEELRPFLRSYIVESPTEGRPFNLEERAMAYRRAKNVSSVEPFGSHLDISRPPHEWIGHSIAAKHPEDTSPRITIGAPGTAKPYSASVFNISGMSFGALGARATEALNRGASIGGFFQNTGEGGISRYHHKGGGDLVWQVGSGYFGCRNRDGTFDPVAFAERAQNDQVKMIELKLSQGAKPGHGGVLPGAKVTVEIAEARGIPIGETCYSPAAHSAFSTPKELLDLIDQMRDLSGGKPVGFKLCIGNRSEFLAICKAMVETGQRVDFVVVDGAEGGTGAAPGEFLDSVGAPLRLGLVFARNALVGCGLKEDIRLGASGKQISAFSLASSMAMGADWVNSARGFMFALGCIQSLSCHKNTCPTGIATTRKSLQTGLIVPDKAERVANFHRNTVRALTEVAGAAGCEHPSELRPIHLRHWVSQTGARAGSKVYNWIKPNGLLNEPRATYLGEDWDRADPDSFKPREDLSGRHPLAAE